MYLFGCVLSSDVFLEALNTRWRTQLVRIHKRGDKISLYSGGKGKFGSVMHQRGI